jgi:hypothetical protein
MVAVTLIFEISKQFLDPNTHRMVIDDLTNFKISQVRDFRVIEDRQTDRQTNRQTDG